MARKRGSSSARGYGRAHQAERRRWADRIDGDELVACARCGHPILPEQTWDLDHTPDRAGYLGPSHARCNRATKSHQPPRRRPLEQHPGLTPGR